MMVAPCAALPPMSPTTLPPAMVLPFFAERFVPAHMIGMHVGVDDVAQRLARGKLADLVEDFVGDRGQPGIHQQHAVRGPSGS